MNLTSETNQIIKDTTKIILRVMGAGMIMAVIGCMLITETKEEVVTIPEMKIGMMIGEIIEMMTGGIAEMIVLGGITIEMTTGMIGMIIETTTEVNFRMIREEETGMKTTGEEEIDNGTTTTTMITEITITMVGTEAMTEEEEEVGATETTTIISETIEMIATTTITMITTAMMNVKVKTEEEGTLMTEGTSKETEISTITTMEEMTTGTEISTTKADEAVATGTVMMEEGEVVEASAVEEAGAEAGSRETTISDHSETMTTSTIRTTREKAQPATSPSAMPQINTDD
jgi:hypothetical protein